MARAWLDRLTRGRLGGAPTGRPGPDRPTLSVVVPVHDVGERLEACVRSLLEQNHPRVEVVVVDDGSTDGSRQVAQRLAEAHPEVRLVRQQHAGVGAARNAGVDAATGDYLAFCDADDVVPENGYARLVRALESSGSDLAVGSVTLQRKGRHVEPDWARRSNPARRLGQSLTDVPELMENLVLGARVFRRAFWRDAGLRFDPEARHADVPTVVQALLAAGSVDVLPAVVYRWQWREDGRTLLQRSLVDRGLMVDRVTALRQAGELLGAAAEPVRRSFYAGVLHAAVPDLVRSAVARDEPYWAALSDQLCRLLDGATPGTLTDVPVEDRVTVWLCAHGRRDVAEQFLQYAFDNHFGYPFRPGTPRPLIALPFVDAVDGLTEADLMVAPADMPYRTRLTALRWLDDHRLLVQGGAFVEYVDDSTGPSAVELRLLDRETGEEVAVPAQPDPTADVNGWSGRANEDHTGGGFAAVVDTAPLRAAGRPRTWEVEVCLEVGGLRRRGPFQSRRAAGSAGLLERTVHDGATVTPSWRPFDGLRLTVEDAAGSVPPGEPDGPRVTGLDGGDDALTVRLAGVGAGELALVGPRTRTAWTPLQPEPGGASARLPLHLDEWGLGPAALPEDRYEVHLRVDGTVTAVPAARAFWRTLPAPVPAGGLEVAPLVSGDGLVSVQLSPSELAQTRGQYRRRRLRDVVYPAARSEPLLEVALFETFAGRAGGDNPGAVCTELARRDTGLDLVCSVVDRSVHVPEGARPVVRWSAEWFELLARARYLVTNAALPYFFRKREGQVYVQTWHGSPLKRIAHDRPHLDFVNWHHTRQLLTARDEWDFLVSQSEFCTGALRSAFRYDGPVLEVGYPRNDPLHAPDAEQVRRRVRAHLGVAAHQRVVLYAPTWRDNLRVGKVYRKVVYLDTATVTRELEDVVVLVRGHYNSLGAEDTSDPGRRVVDVTRYPDIADLYLAADALVTDYSSVFFDFANTDKPMVFLAPDLVEYRDENRGFYVDYHDTVPGPVCVTTDEVLQVLSGPDEHQARRAAFRDTYCYLDDGSAAARVVDAMLGHPG